ncbi:SDR family NAD(P)-dependent oxidoreductase [Undibacterium arcticum]|uniref:SDR family NAD(P)-dependent oxidoreductase n=1 Tax=Undibacterium arcticum TaxID=1762892 RepID=A0ABV7EXA0_9BURK
MKLANKVALITGAGQGMGRAIAQLFAAQGAAVVAADINLAAAEETIASVNTRGDCLARNCDVADGAAVRTLFAEIEARYQRIDILVNNAGVGAAPGDGFDKLMARLNQRYEQQASGEAVSVYPDHIIDMNDSGWRRVVEINLFGTFCCAREAVRLMIKSGVKGSIVNISSTAAFTGEGGVHYCASKAAQLGFTKCLAREVAPRGIRVNAICPGPTDTPMMKTISDEWAQALVQAVPLGRMGEPDEIAKTALFLVSDDASFFTGQSLAPNGGMYML